jgi:hypothetical protein
MYEPRAPNVTVDELAVQDPISHRIVMLMLMKGARGMYQADPSDGLERCLEDAIDLLNTGYIKILFNEEEDMITLGMFDPSSGEYLTGAELEEQNDEFI